MAAGRMRPGGWGFAWGHLKNSLKWTKSKKQFVGDDYLGNRYFEVVVTLGDEPARINRTFEAFNKERWEDVPPEWEAWLRKKRDDPPSHEEIEGNLQLMRQKQLNAARLAAERLAAIEGAPEDFRKLEAGGGREDRVPFPTYSDVDDLSYVGRAPQDDPRKPPERDHTIR
ncbi:hypothetical protein RvY_06584 [Ramazzottius varieornatus]|uniref:NADH dehydrogenase [ubiquinone] 1 alpha subcomplex assembly factor 2 n=1 Tax=Ramazzottius varieornatus TaxID=947166 RepID=A0A1D1V4K0_RAMVA|nr:hypothetical protein RvY_06584 [Ramazzottius varieornatus]